MSDDEDDEEDDEELMSEAERMEEGRRMFQIFAARMFEQRVLTAYREKVRSLSVVTAMLTMMQVASERQKQLLRELEEEERLAEEKEIKKAKENQKKKDKKKYVTPLADG